MSVVLVNQFLEDVIQGLGTNPKTLKSKYFYDPQGDRIFQQIMASEEYYPTRCETEILQRLSPRIADFLITQLGAFDLFELGAGDATKTQYLLEELIGRAHAFSYVPIDISGEMIHYLNEALPERIPGLQVEGVVGDYFKVLRDITGKSQRNKLVLFLGGNIGNMPPQEALLFCRKVKDSLRKGDRMLIGFDLKKNPAIIQRAYDDKGGLTKAFNMNLLIRMNRELGANFILDNFDHYASYDPLTGACNSFLVSLKKQMVQIEDEQFLFEDGEVLYTETSHKYDFTELSQLASEAGFEQEDVFFDSKRWFADAIWKVI